MAMEHHKSLRAMQHTLDAIKERLERDEGHEEAVMPRLLYRPDLDDLQCSNPFCTHRDEAPLYFHARCHPEADVHVGYAHGILAVCCAECHEIVAAIAVKDRPEG